MSTTAIGPRVLLRQLREVMAAPQGVQARLDKIANLIAANVVAEVCSIYVMRPGGELELYSSKGLNPDALHVTMMKVGEGLVGTIARDASLLNLSDAQSHPAFKYLPETGEELFQSFLGVPILKNGLPVGVLVVQNETRRHYSLEEEEAVQTTAMVLAEIISSGALDEVSDAAGGDVAHLKPVYRRASGDVSGIAMGHVVLHEPRAEITNFVARDVDVEKMRLDEAIGTMRGMVDAIISQSDAVAGADYGDILETYRMFAHDRGWVARIVAAIDTGLTAEAAVERVQNENRARLLQVSDPLLRDRLNDLDDLSNRLLRVLTGTALTAAGQDLPEDGVIVARAMGPAELLDYDRSKIRGLVLEGAGANSHVAIVARALDIVMVSDVAGLVELVDAGDEIIIDGSGGEVHIRPTSDVRDAYAEKVRFYARKQARFAELRDTPARSRDGVDMDLQINAGLLVDLPHLAESGATGIGLFRTELQFMIARSFPRFEAQVAHYREVIEAAGDVPVCFRTLDIGSDKMLPYLVSAREANPSLGWRGIRMSMSRPGLLKLQVRALMAAAKGRELKLLLPFVSTLEEYCAARALILEEKQKMERHGHGVPAHILIGAMVEVPSLVWQLDDILDEADFVSVGSNDLAQYLFASDRGNPRVNNRYDVLSPVFLRVLKKIVDKARDHNVPVTLCGEMAGDTLEALALVAIGFRSISMAPASIGPVKAMLQSLDVGEAERFLLPLLDTGQSSVREQLHAFARGNKIAI